MKKYLDELKHEYEQSFQETREAMERELKKLRTLRKEVEKNPLAIREQLAEDYEAQKKKNKKSVQSMLEKLQSINKKTRNST